MRVWIYGITLYLFVTILIPWRLSVSFSKGFIDWVETVIEDYSKATEKIKQYEARIKKSETQLDQIDLEQEMN